MSEHAIAVPEPMLSKEQVATWLGVSERTIERLVEAGDLDPFYVGTAPRFDPAAVRAYLDQTRGRPRRPRRAPAAPRLSERPAVTSLADRVRSRP